VLSHKLIHTSREIDDGGVFSKPVTPKQWLEFNKHLFNTAKIALKPAPDSTDREVKAWKDFQNWLRFHNPPFEESLVNMWLDNPKHRKTSQNQS